MNNYHEAKFVRLQANGYRCEADGLHHPDCPSGITNQNADQFAVHHMIRRGDTDHPWYDYRDDIEFLRVVWNGPTGLGCAGCHGRIHSNQPEARTLDLLWPTERQATNPPPSSAFVPWDGKPDPF